MELTLGFNHLMVLLAGTLFVTFLYIIPLIFKIAAPHRTLRKDRDYTMRKKAAVLIPCFNEGASVYEAIGSHTTADYPHELIHVVVVDDHSTDDSWDWIQKAVADFGHIIKITTFRQPENGGKQDAILRGSSLATDADIFICVDSDCIFDKSAIKEICSSFIDDSIGAVGGHVKVRNVNDNFLTQMQTLTYYYAFDLMRMFENYLGNVTCISGAMFAIQRKAFFEVAPQIASANFIGVRLSAGEDRYLTHMLLLKGYKTLMNMDAYCWTECPNRWGKFFLQRWRWGRSGVFNYFLTIKSIRQHVRVMSPFTVLNMLLPMTVSFYLEFSLFYAMLQGNVLQFLFSVMVILITFFGPFLFAYSIRMRRQSPDQALEAPVMALLPLVTSWAVASAFTCAFIALFTMDSRSWGTRVKAPAPSKDAQSS